MDDNNNLLNNNDFWLNNPTILYSHGKYLDFYPTPTMKNTEKLNALTRFCIYLIIILFLLDISLIKYPIILLIFIVILFYSMKYNKNNNFAETQQNNKIKNKCDKQMELGYKDENDKIKIPVKPKKKVRFSLDQMKEYKKTTCRKPTDDNPFMNKLLTDFSSIDKPEACDPNDSDIKEQINEKFNKDLYMDVDDLFSKKNSQRQFFTMPNMNPEDQTKFGLWLHGGNNICKNSPEKCLKYEDLRFKRGLY